MHFGERTMTDIVKEFNKLRQKGSVEDYQTKSKELRSPLILSHPTLNEQYFMSSFISGLNDELRPTIKMLQPAVFKQAVEKARLQELALEDILKKHRIMSKGYAKGIYKAAGEECLSLAI